VSDIERTIRQPLMSGHCAYPSRGPDGNDSHSRCLGYNRANPQGEFQPCPCPHHYEDCEEFECSGCGRTIKAAPFWPLDEDGDMRYTHIDPATGRATGEDC
jgi:hypothetical protein